MTSQNNIKDRISGLSKHLTEMFSGIKMAVYLVIIFIISVVYLYLITQHITVSVALGIVAMLFGFYHLVYLPEKLNREQHLMKELQKYGMSMAYYLQVGYNVLNALDMSKRNLDKKIKKDIEKTMVKLEDNAELDTSHFEKYNFNSLNIFHQILDIKYNKGGNARDLFTRVNESMNFEIVKRDELHKRKQQLKKRVMMMMGLAASMPLIFVFFANEIYEQFLTTGFLAIGLNVALFISLLVSLFFLQRNVNDISIYN